MKKFCVLFCLMAMILSAVGTPAFAAEPEGNVIDLGDGYYVVETITQYPMSRAGDIVGRSKDAALYYGSKLIGTATLKAAFDISGFSPRAVEAQISGRGENGGQYVNGDTDFSGNKATGTAYFKYNGGDKAITITIVYTP